MLLQIGQGIYVRATVLLLLMPLAVILGYGVMRQLQAREAVVGPFVADGMLTSAEFINTFRALAVTEIFDTNLYVSRSMRAKAHSANLHHRLPHRNVAPCQGGRRSEEAKPRKRRARG